jgi:hypothetical protein
MRRATLCALLATTLAAPAGADELRDSEVNGRYGGYVLVRSGAASAPFYTAAQSEVETELTQARSLIIGGHFRIAPRLTVGARLPVAASSLRQPGGSYVDDKALGNPELFIEDRSFALARGRMSARGAIRLAAGLPLADHGEVGSLNENRALALSDALDGWRNPELFGAGVIPLTLSGRLAIAASPWRLDLRTKLSVAVRLHDASLPAEAKTRPIGITPHLELRGSWWPWPWLGAGAGVYSAAQLPAAVATPGNSRRSGSLDVGLEPRIVLALDSITVTADLSLPVVGPLDDTIAAGLAVAYHR